MYDDERPCLLGPYDPPEPIQVPRPARLLLELVSNDNGTIYTEYDPASGAVVETGILEEIAA
jgi:hypothetical protein